MAGLPDTKTVEVFERAFDEGPTNLKNIDEAVEFGMRDATDSLGRYLC